MRAIHLAPLVLSFAAAAAQAEPIRCYVTVADSQSRPVPDAEVTCGGVTAIRQGVDSTFVAEFDHAGNDPVIVHVTRPDYLPSTTTWWADHSFHAISAGVSLRQPGEPFLRTGAYEWGFVAEADRLLVLLDDFDRAAGKRIPRDALVAELAPLLQRWSLVVVPSRSEPARPGERCGAGPTLMLAQASGTDFRPRRLRALAALRQHPRVRGAGPLIRVNPRESGELGVGHVIHVSTLPASQAALDGFATRNGARWDAIARTLTLPDTIGMAAVDVANALPAEVPGASGELDLGPPVICID